ncbi:MAG: amidinotransferase [Cyclobacteriaceae bacterium]|nr:amidinotransferase [Cyclobacteriaceae bacterium HetDA_MAG_MS6]
MIPIKVLDEFAPLEAVVLGTAKSFGGTPSIEEAYDPKTKEHILTNTFPEEGDLVIELDGVARVLEKYGVKVYRPEVISDYNQIFARDIGIAIGDKFIVPKVLYDRSKESDGLLYIQHQVEDSKVLLPEGSIRIEGGDVMLWNGKILAGYSKEEDFEKYKVARTNEEGIQYLIREFPDWQVIPFELKKSDEDPYENALHLDCCFQPLGMDKAIMHKPGFKNPKDADFLISIFGEENIHFIDREEMYQMNSNIFSIAPDIIISERSFTRLNSQLRDWGFTVEEVMFSEVAKMEGLLRCTTMPLSRTYA